jgi:hypothetical protein
VKRRAALTRRVSAVTQLSTAAAITSTGMVVGALGHQAHLADAAKAQAVKAAPKVVVVAKPVARPVRTVVVRPRSGTRQVPAAQQTTTRARAAAPTRRSSTTTASRPAPAPRATQAAPATKTTGS